MNRQRLKKHLPLIALTALVLLAAWWGLRKLDPTSSATFISDSPDGKYRTAVFCHDTLFGGNPKYEAALFNAHWPHHELPGTRAQWSNDSVNSSNFHPAWRPDGTDITYHTGYGDRRATVSAHDVSGRQDWTGP